MSVVRVGADGDGIAALPDGAALYLAETLPGERVHAHPTERHGAGWLATPALTLPSPDRVTSPCSHFGAAGDACGGCTLQHWQDAPYAEWKRGQLAAALARAGIADAEVGPLGRTPPGARRRMDLALLRQDGRVRIGLHVRRSRAVVEMRACPVLHPHLLDLVQVLRPVLQRVTGLRQSGSVVVNLLDSGPDLLLRTDAPISAADRGILAEFARGAGVPRIAWARGTDMPEPVALLHPPRTTLGRTEVEPPPGAFMQASAEGEAAILDAVMAGLPPALPRRARIVELFAGCGTLTAALAQHARVDAYEGDAPAHAALRRAAIANVAAHHRDLTRQPLSEAELRGTAAVVLDPPWAGAAAQMPALAASGVPCVCYVSCNPDALARDARVLLTTGYRLHAATPIDQFLWSARIESVCVFTRPSAAQRR